MSLLAWTAFTPSVGSLVAFFLRPIEEGIQLFSMKRCYCSPLETAAPHAEVTLVGKKGTRGTSSALFRKKSTRKLWVIRNTRGSLRDLSIKMLHHVHLKLLLNYCYYIYSTVFIRLPPFCLLLLIWVLNTQVPSLFHVKVKLTLYAQHSCSTCLSKSLAFTYPTLEVKVLWELQG